MDSLPLAIHFKDRNHVITSANRRALSASAAFNGHGDRVIGQTDYDLFPEEIADFYYRLEKKALAGNSMVCENELATVDHGKGVWLQSRKYPITDANGEVIGLVSVALDITESTAINDKLRESEELLRESQRIAGIGNYVTDTAKGEWYSSEVLDRIFGIDKAFPHTTQGWAQLLHPEDRADMLAYLTDQVVAGREEFDREYRIVRPSDGAVRWVHGLGQWEFDAQGKPAKMHGTIQDITECKLSEMALRESKELLQLFIEHAPAALAMFDREMRYIAVSHRWLEEYSPQNSDIVGRSHYEIIPDIPERWKETHRRGMAGEAQRVDEDRFERADGTVQWIRWELIPWRAGDGSVGGIVLFAEDITRNKETEDRLRLAANVFTHASEGIYITDAAGAIVEVNETFTRITGYTREEVLGRNPRMFQSGLQSRAFYSTMWCSLLETGHWSGEIWNRTKSGNLYAESITINATRDASGNVVRYVALFTDITLLKERERQLEHIAHFDPLSGLPNRTLLVDRLHQAIAQAHGHKQVLAVAYLDLDGFKKINDLHGRDTGDQLLATLAERMKGALREGDTLARLGGDEFVAVLLDLPDAEASTPILSRLLDAASEEVQTAKQTVRVSASMGVTFYPQGEEVDPDRLLRQADQAMCQAKLAGKNRFHKFDPAHDITIRGHHESREHIRRALADRQFVLYYQPKVNMRTGQVVGAEALIRWKHPERGLLLPASFLPVIEDNPLSLELGEWVLESVLSQMETWLDSGFDVPVSVNVSALQLQQPDFVDRLRKLLAAHPRIKPFSLEIEVLETSALQDVLQSSQILNACHEIGVSFALDDFGTGYSSLTYLKRLPAHALKIDQSFVIDMLNDLESLSILEGVLGLATAFRRQVIAEGVETVEHGLLLMQLGCDLAQGYAIARPMPADDLSAWASAWSPDPRWTNVPLVNHGNRPVLYATVEHRAWLVAFEGYLRGSRQTPPSLDIGQCQFGSWMNAEKQAGRANQAAHRDADAFHRQFHALATEIFASHVHGQNQQAIARIADLHVLCDELLDRLETLKQRG
jgi:diguanylate cyclase (GGDEF)-like protein/PAS domain S-box-containing protein